MNYKIISARKHWTLKNLYVDYLKKILHIIYGSLNVRIDNKIKMKWIKTSQIGNNQLYDWFHCCVQFMQKHKNIFRQAANDSNKVQRNLFYGCIFLFKKLFIAQFEKKKSAEVIQIQSHHFHSSASFVVVAIIAYLKLVPHPLWTSCNFNFNFLYIFCYYPCAQYPIVYNTNNV